MSPFEGIGGVIGTSHPIRLASTVFATESSDPKLTVGLDQYAQAWHLLGERERLCFDLVMFAGMRESEAFALWCGDVKEHGIQIERSWYKGRYEPPKTPKSERTVGVP